MLLRNVRVRIGEEKISVAISLGRILAEDIVSTVNLPPFERAAMDGFAVRAEDTYSASPSTPIVLTKVAELHIGETPNLKIERNETASIVTGAPLPAGSNAVVMVEYSRRLPSGMIEIYTDVRPGENVSHVGEDVAKGTIVLRTGTQILPQDVGMLTGLGLREIAVRSKPKIAILSTGNELVEHSSANGRIVDVNRPMLTAAIQSLECEPIDLGIVGDNYEAIHSRLLEGLNIVDAVLVTAGTSVGSADIVPMVIDSLGSPGMLVHGVALRPSMPTGLAVVNGKPIVSLPGYPVSAYLAFIEFVRPLITHLLRTTLLPMPTMKTRLNRRVAGVLGSRTYVRVQVSRHKDGCIAEPVRTAGAGILSSLVQANGFVVVPENVEGYEEGELVEVELFRACEDRSN